MCGIAGIISSNPSIINLSVLRSMADSLAHRGPDGEGYWSNNQNNAGFAHRRLAVIDLTDAAKQPMHFAGRYTIVYNGEIYNYVELKKELKKAGYHFVSESDTEVILAAYDCYKDKCVQYFDGMFSFAIWDEVHQQLFAARDRFGEKPFYYFANKTTFYFGSEMKALWAAGVPRNPERKMILNYITLGYVQNPADQAQTFFENIYSLPAAHSLKFNSITGKIKIDSYWDIDKQACINIAEPEAIEQLDHLFSASVSRRLRSDVPIGTSLSGGLDSSSIVYYIQQIQKTAGLKTFSAVFPGFKNDESAYIRQIATAFNADSYTTIPTAIDLVSEFEKVAWHQEEPFPSSSIFAQYKVFELAKQQNIKVLLDGQGADEVLAGYHRFIHYYMQEMVSRYKFAGLKKEQAAFQKNSIRFNWNINNYVAALLPSHASIALEKREYLKIIQHAEVSRNLLGCLRGREWEGIHKPVVTKLNDILYFATRQHGLYELLRYSDRNSMAHGREVRLPFLSEELVKFVFSLPSRFKIRNGFTKYVLRMLMDKNLPENIVWRTDKVGFEPPQKQWMDEALLKDFIFEAKSKLVKEDILKPGALQKKGGRLNAHDADNFDWRYLCVAHILNNNSSLVK